MTKKVLLAISAATLALSAAQANAQAFPPRANDETDQRWVYRAPGSGAIPERTPSGAFKDYVRRGDENDQRWLYVAPGTRLARTVDGSSVGASRHGDETDQRWMEEHKPPFKR